jgi:hypothetical protein
MLSDNDKFQLRQMLEQNNVVDKTDQIRELKHSAEIRTSIQKLMQLKIEHADLLRENKPKFEEISVRECNFLFFNYMELYNIILKETMDASILFKLLDVLSKIESSDLDQHEGSFMVGKYLKEIYIDSKLAESKRLDALYPSAVQIEPKNITWQEFSKKNNV